MESLRILQRQTLQQFLRTRSLGTNLHYLQAQSSGALRIARSTPRLQTRSFQTRIQSPFSKFRRFPKSLDRTGRPFATATNTATENLSLSQRLKKLSREYGWTALGVYLLLSALDFPFCFLAVRLLGTDRIGHWEHVVVSKVKEWIKWPLGSEAQDTIDSGAQQIQSAAEEIIPLDDGAQRRLLDEEAKAGPFAIVDHGYKNAQKANTGANASIWTQLALAYAIHKSFIFIRVPLTAAILPKVVKTLRSWGYNIGKRPAKKVSTTTSSTGTVGVNTKGSGVKSD